jgi:secreted trypsin-like serine protease
MVSVKEISSTGEIGYGSGVQIDQRHVLTAAHVVDSNTSEGMTPLERVSVIIGGNNIMVDGVEMSVRRYAYHSTYTPGTPSGASGQNGIDIAILELDQPIAGRGIDLAQAAPATNDVLNFVGYGRAAVATSSSLEPLDGKSRGWEMKTYSSVLGGFNSSLYKTARGSTSDTVLTLPGYGANRDSGGMVANQQGQLVGLIIK